MVSQGFRHFLIFLFLIFFGLFLFVNERRSHQEPSTVPHVLRVFYLSQLGGYGAEAISMLKTSFEQKCGCKVELIEIGDSGILIQRLKIEGEALGVDLVMGLDHLDLVRANAEVRWKKLKRPEISWFAEARQALVSEYFVPFGWNVHLFLGALDIKGLESLSGLNQLQFKKKIGFEDPRLRASGLGLLMWIVKSFGGDGAGPYMARLEQQQPRLFSSLDQIFRSYQSGDIDIFFSYVTSLSLMKDQGFTRPLQALSFSSSDAHPLRYEFFGVPESCRSCDLAEGFVQFVLQPEGQQTLLKKGYLLPVNQSVPLGTDYDFVKRWNLEKNFDIHSTKKFDFWLREWAKLSRDMVSQ